MSTSQGFGAAWWPKALFLGALLASGRLQAQVLTSQGLQCGGSAVSLDSSRGATLGANGARKQELDELYSRETEATAACKEKLPGCAALADWLTETAAAAKKADQDDWINFLPRARETGMRAEFARIQAHSVCKAGAGARYDAACEGLIEAEEAAAHLGFVGVPSPVRQEAILQLAMTGQVANFSPRPGVAPNATFQALQSECAGKGCSAAKEQTVRVVRALSRIEQFYQNAPTSFAKFASEEIALRADAVPVGGHEHRSLNPKLPSGNAANPYLLALWNLAARQAQDCDRATLRVTPSGALLYQPEYEEQFTAADCKDERAAVSRSPQDPKANRALKTCKRKLGPHICVDTSRYSIARPFEVEVAEYPLDTATGSSMHGQTYSAFAGEPTPIKLQRSSLIRVTVRGYPSGASLRFLASRGGTDLAMQAGVGTSELLTQQLAAANRQSAYDQKLAAIASLTRLSNAVATDAELIASVQALNAAIATAALKAGAKDELEAARAATQKAVDTYRAALGRFRAGVDGTNAVNDAQAVAQAETLTPAVPAPTSDTGGLPAGAAGVSALQAIAIRLVGIAGSISNKASELQPAVDALAREMALQDRTLERLCRLSNSLIPVVDEDVLIEPSDPSKSEIYVLDYDYDAGFRRTTADKLWSNKRLFVRVRHVRPNEGVALVLDNGQIVTHPPSLIGFPTTPAPASNEGTFSTSAHAVTADDDPDRPLIQARSTQILPLGKLAGGRRYDMTLCAQSGPVPPACSQSSPGTQSPTTPPSASRVIARNTIVVHENHYLGVRAGFGATLVFGRVRSVSTMPGTPPQYLVTENERTADFALPILLAWYPQGRDATEGPPQFSWGLVSGIDMLKIASPPPIYFGATADFSGFGITAGGLIQSLESVNAPANTYLPSADAGTKQSSWHGGFFAALTTDFDIFQAVFKQYFVKATWPTVGNAPASSSGGGS